MSDPSNQEKEAIDRERFEILGQVEDILEVPVLVLGFVWLVLLVIDLIWGLTPLLETFFYIIWGIFIIDFLLRFILAPYKFQYLRSNWLTAISLMIPALRVFHALRFIRLIRMARAARSLNLVRVVGTINRSMRALRGSFSRRGFGYVTLLTLLVMFAGSAGMFAFERGVEGFENFSDALWWTAMIMTTLGSGEWPRTPEGRMLGFLLALYGFAVFGYVTATLASFFIGREAEADESELAGSRQIEALKEEIKALREELREASSKNRRDE